MSVGRLALILVLQILLHTCKAVTVPPDQPTNVTVTSQTTTSLGLTWTNGFSGSSDITGVEIEYKETVVTVGISLMEISIPGDASLESTYLTNLLPFRSYNICVFVVSRHDRSLPGKAIGETLSLFLKEPTITKLDPLDTTTIALEWQPPTVNMTTTDAIHSWEIEYEVVGNVGRRAVLLVNDSATTRHALKVEKGGTQYRVRVAGLNVRGRGAWSPYMVAETLEDTDTLSPGSIIGIVLGVIFGIVLIAVVVLICQLTSGKCKFATGGHTAETAPPPTTTDAAEISYIAYSKPQCPPTNATSTDGAVCDNIAYAGNLHTHEHTTDPEYERLD